MIKKTGTERDKNGREKMRERDRGRSRVAGAFNVLHLAHLAQMVSVGDYISSCSSVPKGRLVEMPDS